MRGVAFRKQTRTRPGVFAADYDRRYQGEHRHYRRAEEHLVRIVEDLFSHCFGIGVPAVFVDYRIAYRGTYDHREQHEQEHPDALKTSLFPLRDVVAEGGNEQSADGKFRRHRDYAHGYQHAEQSGGVPRAEEFDEVYPQRAGDGGEHQRNEEVFSAELVHQKSRQSREHGGAHYYYCERHDVILHPQRAFHEIYEVGHVHLHARSRYAGTGERDVQHFVLLYHGGAEAVDELFAEIRIGVLRKSRLVLQHEESEYAADYRHRAQDHEEQPPLFRALCGQAVKTYEYDDHGKHRHHGEHRVRLAAVGGVGHVREPRVERRVVCRRAHPRHHAVHDDYAGDKSAELFGGVIYGEEGKHHYREPPDDESPRYEHRTLARFVAYRARYDGGGGGENRGKRDHKGGRPRFVNELVLHEFGEIHVFDDPCDLSYQPEKQKTKPDFSAERRGLCRSGIRGDFPDHMLTLRKVLGSAAEVLHTSHERRNTPLASPLHIHFTIAPPRCQYAKSHRRTECAFFLPSAASVRYRDFDRVHLPPPAAFRQI